MGARAVQPGASRVSPIISPETYEQIASGKAVSQGLDGLPSGLSTLMIPKTCGSAAIKTRAPASTHQLLCGGGSAPSLQDVAALMSSAPSVPATTVARVMQSKGRRARGEERLF